MEGQADPDIQLPDEWSSTVIEYFTFLFGFDECMKEIYIYNMCGPGSSVGIVTGYGLDGPASYPGGDEIFRPFRPAERFL